MKKRNTPSLSSQDWVHEFQEFISAEPVAPPKVLSEHILSRVHQDLNPPLWSVFAKITGIHFIVGSLSLLVCPQFGMSPFHDHHGMMQIFMHFGDHGCMIGCGAIFLGGSSLAASLILRTEEIKVIRRTRFMQIFLLGLASMAVFICAGADVVVSLGAAWVIGSMIGGVATLELGWLIRTTLRRRLLSHGF